jgi:HSP20 family protein
MALLRHRTQPATEKSAWTWDEWPELFFRPWMNRFGDERFMRVEQFAEDDTLAVRADLPGIDPDKDVEISLADHTLTVEAERREEKRIEKRRYMCSELRYGSFSRSITVPEGVTDADIDNPGRPGPQGVAGGAARHRG